MCDDTDSSERPFHVLECVGLFAGCACVEQQVSNWWGEF